jgi:hypothetical protein
MQDMFEIRMHAEDLPDGRLGVLLVKGGAERFLTFDRRGETRDAVLMREIPGILSAGGSKPGTILGVAVKDVPALVEADLDVLVRPLEEKQRLWLADLFQNWVESEARDAIGSKSERRSSASPIPPFKSDLGSEADSPVDARDAEPLERLRAALTEVAGEMRAACDSARSLAAGDRRDIAAFLDAMSGPTGPGARLDRIEAALAELALKIEAPAIPRRPSLARRIMASLIVALGSIFIAIVAASFGAMIGWHYGGGLDPLHLFEPGSKGAPEFRHRGSVIEHDV